MMLIDQLYSKSNDKYKNESKVKYPDYLEDKNNFYLGKISYVSGNKCTVQAENLSILKNRKNMLEDIHANTIGTQVIIESNEGLFIGNIYESRVKPNDTVHKNLNRNEDSHVYPEVTVAIQGILNKNKKFSMPGIYTVGLTDKVYIASRKASGIYWNSLTKRNSKDNESKLIHFSDVLGVNKPFKIDPNDLFNRHLLVVGSTNSGKSTSSLSILDKMIQKNKKVLIVDPTGEYEQSFKNESNKFDIVTLGENCYINTEDVSLSDWCNLFLTNDQTQPAVLMRAMQTLTKEKGEYKKAKKTREKVEKELNNLDEIKKFSFDINKLTKQIYYNSVSVMKKPANTYGYDNYKISMNQYLIDKIDRQINEHKIDDYFRSAKLVEDDENTEDDEMSLIKKLESFCNGEIEDLYINASKLDDNNDFGRFVINLIAKNVLLYQSKIKDEKRNNIQPFVFYVDEAHRYLQGAPELNDYLVSIGREGRKNGIFLFLTTQRPSDIPSSLLSQIGTFIVHRLWQKDDIDIMSRVIRNHSISVVKKLKTGEAILSGVNILDDVPLKFNKSHRNHNNITPEF